MEGDTTTAETENVGSTEKALDTEGNEQKDDSGISTEINDSLDNMPENVFSIDRSCIPTVPQNDQVCHII